MVESSSMLPRVSRVRAWAATRWERNQLVELVNKGRLDNLGLLGGAGGGGGRSRHGTRGRGAVPRGRVVGAAVWLGIVVVGRRGGVAGGRRVGRGDVHGVARRRRHGGGRARKRNHSRGDAMARPVWRQGRGVGAFSCRGHWRCRRKKWQSVSLRRRASIGSGEWGRPQAGEQDRAAMQEQVQREMGSRSRGGTGGQWRDGREGGRRRCWREGGDGGEVR